MLWRTLLAWRGPAGAYLVLGLALWPVPVVGLLHAEASAVVAADETLMRRA